MDCIYLDFAKAYNTMLHNAILVNMIKQVNITRDVERQVKRHMNRRMMRQLGSLVACHKNLAWDLYSFWFRLQTSQSE